MWRSKGRRAETDEIHDLVRRLELAANEIDRVVAKAREAEAEIRARERSASAALADGRAGTRGRIGAETMNSALERVARISSEADSVSRTLKRAAAALSGRGARPSRRREGGGSEGDLSLRRMPSPERAVDRSR